MTDPLLHSYACDDGNACVSIPASSPREAAQQYVDGGDWGESTETFWISVLVTEEVDEGDEDARLDAECAAESHLIAVDPDEPECLDGGEHDWRAPHCLVGGMESNPGVQGHGGGVVSVEVCVVCGCVLTSDSWAQDRASGQQGLDSVSYDTADGRLEDYLENLDIEDLETTTIEGGTLVEGPWGWWGAEADSFVEWYRSEDEARNSL